MDFNLVYDYQASSRAQIYTFLSILPIVIGLFGLFNAAVLSCHKLYTVIFSIMTVLGIACLVFGLSGTTIPSAENLQSNLKMKYGIEGIVDDTRYPIDYTSADPQKILVELPDEREAVFVLTQNFETQEPTLEDITTNPAPLNTENADRILVEEIVKGNK